MQNIQIGEGPKLDKIKSLAKTIVNTGKKGIPSPKSLAKAYAAALALGSLYLGAKALPHVLEGQKLAREKAERERAQQEPVFGPDDDFQAGSGIENDFQALEAELGQSGTGPRLERLKKIAQSILNKIPAGAKTLGEAIKVGKQLIEIRKQLSGTGDISLQGWPVDESPPFRPLAQTKPLFNGRGAMRTSLRGGNGLYGDLPHPGDYNWVLEGEDIPGIPRAHTPPVPIMLHQDPPARIGAIDPEVRGPDAIWPWTPSQIVDRQILATRAALRPAGDNPLTCPMPANRHNYKNRPTYTLHRHLRKHWRSVHLKED